MVVGCVFEISADEGSSLGRVAVGVFIIWGAACLVLNGSFASAALVGSARLTETGDKATT